MGSCLLNGVKPLVTSLKTHVPASRTSFKTNPDILASQADKRFGNSSSTSPRESRANWSPDQRLCWKRGNGSIERVNGQEKWKDLIMAETLRYLLQRYGCVSVCLTQLLPWWQSSPKNHKKRTRWMIACARCRRGEVAADGDDLAFVGGAWCCYWGPANVKMSLVSSVVFSSWTDVSRAGVNC